MTRARRAFVAAAVLASVASEAKAKPSEPGTRVPRAPAPATRPSAPKKGTSLPPRSPAKRADEAPPHERKDKSRKPPPANASWLPYRKAPWRRGFVTVSGHGMHWSGYLLGPRGGVLPMARRSFSHVLASWRTGKELLVDERLIELVADVSDEFGGRPIRVVSGYREHSYAPDSKHKVGQAFDFSVPGVPNQVLRDYLHTLPDVGVGYYPNSTHVHLDVREKSTYWTDYSAPGEAPQYSYDRRVARWSPRERALAAALDAIPSEVTRGILGDDAAEEEHEPSALDATPPLEASR